MARRTRWSTPAMPWRRPLIGIIGGMSSAVHPRPRAPSKPSNAASCPHFRLSALSAWMSIPTGGEVKSCSAPVPWRSMSPGRFATRCATPASSASAAPPSPPLKLSPAAGHVDTLIVNGAECEPFITCDDLLMRDPADISRPHPAHIAGRSYWSASRTTSRGDCRHDGRIARLPIEVVPVPTRYPAGGEKQLIRVLTGIEIPYRRSAPTSACSASTSARPSTRAR